MAAKKEMNPFELTIKAYLDKRASEDKLFAKAYAKENKSIERCCLYIIGEAQKQKFNTEKGDMAALPDAEVYGMAVHYYDEDDMEIDKVSDEEVEQAKKVVDEQIKIASTSQGGFGMELDLFG